MTRCESCGKQRSDVQGFKDEPDAPTMCFICRVEWRRNKRVWDNASKGYVLLDAIFERAASVRDGRETR